MNTSRPPERISPGRAYAAAVVAPLCCALLATPLTHYLDLVNIIMLFLLVVVACAALLGRGPAVAATLVSVGAFDFAFVPPPFSFTVADGQYLITFVVMLITGLLIAQLTSQLREQARAALGREAQTHALYEFAKELSGTLQREQIAELTRHHVRAMFFAPSALLLPDEDNRLRMAETPGDGAPAMPFGVLELGVAQWAFDNARPAGPGTDMMPASRFLYVPLIAPVRPRGVLAVQLHGSRTNAPQQLGIFGALVAIALERVHYIDVAQRAMLDMESERLRHSLLAALSHDIRTPLTSLVGLAEALAMSDPPLQPQQRELAEALREEAQRMNGMASTLLDMARLQSGSVQLNLQWQSLEEVVGSALRACAVPLRAHVIRTCVPAGLPLARFDAVLMERVLCNLLENAAKYTPPGTPVTVSGWQRGNWLEVEVRDGGPGLPAGREEQLFGKFVRGERESALPGVGLGLSLCRAILQAHGGDIHGANVPGGGASFLFRLPLEAVPAVPDAADLPEAGREPAAPSHAGGRASA
ncbi:DUF4118 domain-containing protein [Noviherbaspirillum galbum]|nr:DUF4118 domain-containing protein [Noviherbaspirillum galbum]